MAKQENKKTDLCEWTIVAPKGNKINITFTSFNLVRSALRRYFLGSLMTKDCNHTHLSVRKIYSFKYYLKPLLPIFTTLKNYVILFLDI